MLTMQENFKRLAREGKTPQDIAAIYDGVTFEGWFKALGETSVTPAFVEKVLALSENEADAIRAGL